MKRIYFLMDRIFDPLPKELRELQKARNKLETILYYASQDESYQRYKHLQYRNLILEVLLSFILGLLFGALRVFI